jgi:hypothetical protein
VGMKNRPRKKIESTGTTFGSALELTVPTATGTAPSRYRASCPADRLCAGSRYASRRYGLAFSML